MKGGSSGILLISEPNQGEDGIRYGVGVNAVGQFGSGGGWQTGHG